MKRVVTISLSVFVGFLLGVLSLGLSLHVSAGAGSGGDQFATRNGDVNGDRRINIADPVYLLNWLFSHGPDIVPVARVTATGQTKCYDPAGAQIPCDGATCPGQDGFYSTGCPSEGRFADGGDGTVTDTCTGLVRQKELAPGVYTWCTLHFGDSAGTGVLGPDRLAMFSPSAGSKRGAHEGLSTPRAVPDRGVAGGISLRPRLPWKPFQL